MSDSSRHALSHDELVALAGLVRVMMMADRTVSSAEAHASAALAGRLAKLPPAPAPTDPYRSAVLHAAPLSRTDWEAIWYEAVRVLPTEAHVREVALALDRPEAREIVYGLVYEIATVDTIVNSEWAVLEWLERAWDLRSDG